MTTTTIAKSPAGKVARSTNVARSTPVDAAATRSPRAGEAGAISPTSAPPSSESRSRDDHRMYLSFDRADLIVERRPHPHTLPNAVMKWCSR
jgi:hypothetical protein